MTFEISEFPLAVSTLDIEISLENLDQAWEQSQYFSSPSSCHNAYLNLLCYLKIVDFLQYYLQQEEYPPSAPSVKLANKKATLPSYWEFINGTAITIENKKIVLVPSESFYKSELRVPQEWIDIPSLAPDYFVAVRVNQDNKLLELWGYTTHHRFKTKGEYDATERTYCLPEEELICDINILWVALELCPDEQTRALVKPLPNLTLEYAKNLLERLGKPAIKNPRLEVPFETWGALIAHDGWRKNLYQRRLGNSEPEKQWSILQWLSDGVSNIAQQLDWTLVQLQPNQDTTKGTGDEELQQPNKKFCLLLSIDGKEYKLEVGLPPENNLEQNIWRFKLCNAFPGGRIPPGFKLRLLTEDKKPFDRNEAVATTSRDSLYIDVELDPGEGIIWETEPLPENYEGQPLYF